MIANTPDYVIVEIPSYSEYMPLLNRQPFVSAHAVPVPAPQVWLQR